MFSVTEPNGAQAQHTNGTTPNGHHYPDVSTPAITSGTLAPQHAATLSDESAISADAIQARGYWTETDRDNLDALGFARRQCLVPALVIPLHNWRGERVSYLLRADIPRNETTNGKPIKYEKPAGTSAVLDIAPLTRADIDAPGKPLIITEGAKKADAAASQGLCAINLSGVHGFRGTNTKGGVTALADWENIALKGRTVFIAYDSDVATKTQVELAMRRLIPFLQAFGATVKVIYLPEGANGAKTGLDDFFARGGTVAELFALARDLEPIEESRRKRKEAKNAQVLESLRAGGVPLIETNDRQSDDELTDLAKAVESYNTQTPRIFHGAGGLVHIQRDKDGEPFLMPLSLEAMQVLAGKAARWISTSEREGIRNIAPPRDLCANFLKAPADWRGILPIDAIKTAPFVNADNTLCATPGYHANARIWLSLPDGFALPDTTPTPENTEYSKRLILETLLGEVAFVDDASRAHAVGLMVLPFVRALIDDQTPLHLFDAPTQSSGKTYAAQICVAPFSEAIPSPEKKNDEENRKSLFAQLATGCSHVFLDNIKGRLSDPTLAAAITVKSMKDRLIGTGQMVTVSTRVTWLATSNNAELDRDAVSRCIMIRLDTNDENPEGREFCGDPLRYIAANRAQVIGAILTLVRAWQAAGSPEKSGKRLSRFPRWERVIGGILEMNGIGGFLDNIQDARNTLDPETDAWRVFVTTWHAEHGSSYLTTKELLPVALKCDEMAAIIGEKEGQTTRLGKLLLSKRDKVFCGLKISRVAESTRVAKWRVSPNQSKTDEKLQVLRDIRDTPYPTRNPVFLSLNTEKDNEVIKCGLSDTLCSDPRNPKHLHETAESEAPHQPHQKPERAVQDFSRVEALSEMAAVAAVAAVPTVNETDEGDPGKVVAQAWKKFRSGAISEAQRDALLRYANATDENEVV